MFTLRGKNWVPWAVALGLLAFMPLCGALAEEGGRELEGAGFMSMARKAGFMEIILLLVSISGVALFLQALVTIRKNLLRPPDLAAELLNLAQEGRFDEALEVSQTDDSFLGKVASAALSNLNYGKEAMEGAMSDAGEIEAARHMHKIGQLAMIAAIAPMLGLTGTTIGMIMTFSQIAAKADTVTAADMAEGIAVALVCTFTGLAIAVPLLVGSFYLRSSLMQTIHEIVNDVNDVIRCTLAQEGSSAAQQ